MVVLNRARDAAGHHHRAGLAADLVERQHLVVEVVHHDLGLELDGLLVALDVAAQLLLGAFRVELGIPLNRLDKLVVARDRRVGPQHVQDEAFLDGLLHGVAVERAVLPLPARVVRLAEDLQCLVLGRGREGEIARVREELPRRHDAVYPVLWGLVLFLGTRCGERQADRGRSLAALARMRLVDEDGEASAPRLVPDRIEDERELLDRRDDDLLPVFEQCAEVARAVGMADGGPDLGELPDRVADLLVKEAPVGHHDDGVEHRRIVFPQSD